MIGKFITLQEAELVALLRRLEIGAAELQLVRDRAKKFIRNASAFALSPHPRVLPILLAHYILDALSYSHNVTSSCQGYLFLFSREKYDFFK